MAACKKCPVCGDNLDFGESCETCREKEKARLAERTDSVPINNSTSIYHKRKRKSIRNGGKV